MHQSRTFARFSRALLSGAAALSACAFAAVPRGGPFGADATGNFEPSTPLAGGGWQLLSSARQTKVAANQPAATAKLAATVTDLQPAAPAYSLAVAPVVAPAETASAPVPTVSNGTKTWTVSPADGNYRLLIEGWAQRSGWLAAPWELEKDVEIEGGDTFEADFKGAVRRVLLSTEMTDYSLKPCFYSNNMVRVVKQTTKCDPSK